MIRRVGFVIGMILGICMITSGFSQDIPPVANDDVATTGQDEEVRVEVLNNDTKGDYDFDTAKLDLDLSRNGIQKNFNTPEGQWQNDKGVIRFKPRIGFTGNAVNSYIVYDRRDNPSNPATITITVTPANVAPVAVNDTGGTTVNNPTTVNVIANDTDSDGTIDPSSVDLNTTLPGIQATASNAQGTWSVADGIVTYTPIAAFFGTASLAYTVSDNEGAVSNIAQVTITVQLLNLRPIAVNDNVTTTKNKAVSIKVTANDTDVDGSIDVTTVDLNTAAADVQSTAVTDQGSWAADATGLVTYTPATNFSGVAALSYVVADNAGAISNAATITVTVQDVNAPPVAADDVAATSANTVVTINVVANDTDSDGVIDAAKVDLNTTTAGIQNTITTNQGTFSVNNIGIVTYTPAKDFVGSASATYTVNDNTGAVSNVARITINVQPVNAPVANDDRAVTKMNVPVDFNVVANDSDSDGSIDIATVDLNPSTAGVQRTFNATGGRFSVTEEGIVNFTPAKDFSGSSQATYVVKDDKGVLSNVAGISVTVELVPNLAPLITRFEEANDTLRSTPGNPIEITEVFEAQDQDSDSLAVVEIGFGTNSYVAGKDKLTFTNTSLIKGSFDAKTGLLKLTGPAPSDRFIDAVRTVRYEFTAADEFRDNIKSIYVRVSDGSTFSEIKTRIIKINAGVTELDIPTAFTPNNDGANDTWRILAPTTISGSEFANASIKVYDKRGTMVFDANGLANTWDGTYQGKLLPVDTYYYTIDLKAKRYKGIVAILR